MTLWQLIKEDFTVPRQNDPALHSNIELIFNYPGVWAIVNYRISNALYTRDFKILARVVNGLSQFLTNADIHPSATIGRRVFIDHGFGVVIGETSIVKDDVLIYQGVTLGGVSLNHGKRHPTICSNVILGSGAKILGDITIGKNSKIGANSVVINNVDENSTAVGIPARVVKRRSLCATHDHNILPDINKELFEYMLKRVAILEHAIKKYDGIDVSEEDKNLEKIYANFIASMQSK
jgi:serine O-acetyltransferase